MTTVYDMEGRWRAEVGDSDVNPNSTWDVIDEAMQSQVPEGAVTLGQVAAKYKLAKSTARDRVSKMVQEGKLRELAIGNRKYYVPCAPKPAA